MKCLEAAAISEAESQSPSLCGCSFSEQRINYKKLTALLCPHRLYFCLAKVYTFLGAVWDSSQLTAAPESSPTVSKACTHHLNGNPCRREECLCNRHAIVLARYKLRSCEGTAALLHQLALRRQPHCRKPEVRWLMSRDISTTSLGISILIMILAMSDSSCAAWRRLATCESVHRCTTAASPTAWPVSRCGGDAVARSRSVKRR